MGAWTTNRPRYGILAASTLTAAACVAFTGAANAQTTGPAERLPASPARIMSEPGEVTDVVDAFDDDKAFDLHFSLGFQQTWKNAKIRRESSINNAANPGLASGGYISPNMNVAAYSESTSRLLPRVDIGLYKDIALYLRMPVVLSNSRSLDDLAGSTGQQGVILAGNPGEGQLFKLPFKSPQRSGIDYFAVGADVAIMNQARDSTKPTWLIGVEGRFSVGEPMHACNDSPPAGQPSCAYLGDVNRNGQQDGAVDPTYGSLEGNFSGQRGPGVSRGTNAVEAHTMVSRRIKYVEPYAGFRMLAEFAQDRSDFGATDLQGSVVNHFPLQGWMIFGTQVIPWENREEFQRVTFDFRFTGTYRSEGRDYSELFDALGSSAAPSLRNPQWSGYRPQDPNNASSVSIADPASQKVYFSGITQVQAYGSFQLSTSATWQAAEYIKFQIGFGYTREQGHLLTAEQPCNPDFVGNKGAAGPCKSTDNSGITGVPNPNYRAAISAPGHRFRVDDSTLVDAWLKAVVMF